MKALLRLAAAALLALPVVQVRPDEAKEETVSVDELGEQLGVIYRKFLFTFDKPVHATLTFRVTQNGETKTEYCGLREPATAIRSCFIWKRSDPLPGGGPSQTPSRKIKEGRKTPSGRLKRHRKSLYSK
jgi:hypothetical protein